MNRVAFVTGASSGFGLLTALRLARRADFQRVYALVRSENKAQDLRDQLGSQGTAPKVHVVFGDVTDSKAMTEAMRQIQSQSGRLDVLVNNAGYGLGGFFEDLTDQEIRAQMETNFFGVLTLCRLSLPLLRQTVQDKGVRARIIQVSSISGKVAFPGVGAYNSSKFALEGFSEALRHEVSPLGVDVVLVEPGSYETKIFGPNLRVGQGVQNSKSPYYERTQRVFKMVSQQRRNSQPDEVAALIERVAVCRKPGLRYLVGTDAKIANFIKTWLPFRLLELMADRAR